MPDNCARSKQTAFIQLCSYKHGRLDIFVEDHQLLTRVFKAILEDEGQMILKESIHWICISLSYTEMFKNYHWSNSAGDKEHLILGERHQ